MKPEWKDAPEWANWLAMDQNGEWFWYADKPIIASDYSVKWVVSRESTISYAGGNEDNWQESLEEKPK